MFLSSGSVGVHAKSRVFSFNKETDKWWTPKGSAIDEKSKGFVSDESSVSMSRDGNTIAIGSSGSRKQATSAGKTQPRLSKSIHVCIWSLD